MINDSIYGEGEIALEDAIGEGFNYFYCRIMYRRNGCSKIN